MKLRSETEQVWFKALFFYTYIHIYMYNYMYICIAMLGLHIAARGLSLFVESGDFSLVVVCGLLIVVVSLLVEHRL